MNAVILGYARTPYCKINGQLAHLTAVELGAIALHQALKNAQVEPVQVDHVIAGQVIQTGSGQNPARQTAVRANIPNTVPAITINSVCLSGADAVIQATQLIQLHEAEVVAVVGQESMSNAPHAQLHSRQGKKYGQITMIDTLEIDGLTDAFSKESMGLATEKTTTTISREQQDLVAFNSHQRAEKAKSWVAEEIAPVTFREHTITDDDGIRADTTLETLGKIKPAFSPTGTITAANASPLTDGAAALIIVSEDFAKKHELRALVKILSYAKVAGPDYSLNLQPSNAIQQALDIANLNVNDLNQIEINEAFAAVAVASTEALNLSPEKVNVDGGAIALGHPIGSSGARIVGHLARNLNKLGAATKGAIGICGGGGQGVAIILEAI